MNTVPTQTDHFGNLFLQGPPSSVYFNDFTAYLAFSIILSVIVLFFVPKRFVQSNLYLLLLFVMLNLFVPIFGAIVVLIGVFTIRYYARSYKQVEVMTTTQKQFGSEKFANISPYAAGWAYKRVFNVSFDKEERERALYAINKNRTKQVNDVNRALLDDSSYEIRLYAFNVLNKQQTLITNAIKDYINVRDQVVDSMEFARINKSLAYLYWEYFLLNHDLVELSGEMLQKAHAYAMVATESFPTDGHLWLLLAKIFKELKQPEKYLETLKILIGFDYVPIEAYLNLAAVQYEDHHYGLVKDYIDNGAAMYDISTNASLIKFWCPHG